jgi:hypothetical protein
MNAWNAVGGAGTSSRFNLSTFLSMIVIGSAICLLGFNYFHTLNCPNNNPDATEASIAALSYRLERSEALVYRNSATLKRLLKDMQEDLTPVDASALERIHTESLRTAVKLALLQAQRRSPSKPISFEREHGIERKYFAKDGWKNDNEWETEGEGGGGSSWEREKGKRGDDYVSGEFGPDGWEEGEEDKLWQDPDKFGGRKRNDDKQQVGLDDPWDDPAEGNNVASGEVFRDNLSDADARHICSDWKAEHNVVVGVSWGSLPFQLQQKWVQYACDYLLSSA